MPDEWFYTRDGQQQHGPFASQQLLQLARAGQLFPTDSVWKQGMAEWTPASRIKGLFPEANTAASAPPVSRPVAAPAPLWTMQTANGQTYGPVTKAELDTWYASGQITKDCQLLQDGWPQWKWADEVYPGLSVSQPTVVPPSAPYVVAQPVRSPSVVAEALGESRNWARKQARGFVKFYVKLGIGMLLLFGSCSLLFRGAGRPAASTGGSQQEVATSAMSGGFPVTNPTHLAALRKKDSDKQGVLERFDELPTPITTSLDEGKEVWSLRGYRRDHKEDTEQNVDLYLVFSTQGELLFTVKAACHPVESFEHAMMWGKGTAPVNYWWKEEETHPTNDRDVSNTWSGQIKSANEAEVKNVWHLELGTGRTKQDTTAFYTEMTREITISGAEWSERVTERRVTEWTEEFKASVRERAPNLSNTDKTTTKTYSGSVERLKPGKRVAVRATTQQPKSKAGAASVTKAEFRKVVCSFEGYPDSWNGVNAPLDSIATILEGKDFQRAFGEPQRTQVVGDLNYLYWTCTDGTVQVVTNASAEGGDAGSTPADPLSRRKLYLSAINDY